MIDVIYSGRGNDFYREICLNVVEELNRVGSSARSRDVAELLRTDADANDTALLVNWGEMIQTLPGDGAVVGRAAAALHRYQRRVLLNLDSLQSHWFDRQFCGDGVVTGVVDIGMLRQKSGNAICGVPYQWIPECLTMRELRNLETWSPARPFRWCLLAHQTSERVALAGEIVDALGPQGFLWLPGLRPFTARDSRSLKTAGRTAVLRKSDFYIWTSHHPWPYHEGLRAIHAISFGAIPAKIDPVYHHLFADVPWVYPDVKSLRDRSERLGCRAMYDHARAYLESRGSLGERLNGALSKLEQSAGKSRDHLPEQGDLIRDSKAGGT